MNTLQSDVVIIGGGIAGLWTLNRLRAKGYHAVLIESAALGAGQTLASQGIIHGGTKYALTGKLTPAATAIQAMPALWQNCFQGKGELDLRLVKILSPYQYLWVDQSLVSRLGGFFASKLMHSRMHKLTPQAFPAPFDHQCFQGSVYQLNEPVIDTQSLIKALAQPYKSFIYSLSVSAMSRDNENFWILRESSGCWQLKSKIVVFSAGQGNTKLAQLSGLPNMPPMQIRPLHMPMVKGKLPNLYAHGLGLSALPRVTITSHVIDQETVWYIGGELAEKGIDYSREQQIIATKNYLQQLLPWVALDNCQWSTLMINRAEPKILDGSRPNEVFASLNQSIITAWPVKLAMAPLLAARVAHLLTQTEVKPGTSISSNPQAVPSPPPVADYPWQKQTDWQLLR